MDLTANLQLEQKYRSPNLKGSFFLSKRDKIWFNVAAETANLSSVKRAKVGCIAVYKHRIVSSGCNTSKTDPLQKKMNAIRFVEDKGKHANRSCHAEFRCLKPLIASRFKDFEKAKLYICRAICDDLGMARPCYSCYKLIQSLGIKHIYYSGYHGVFYKENILTGYCFSSASVEYLV